MFLTNNDMFVLKQVSTTLNIGKDLSQELLDNFIEVVDKLEKQKMNKRTYSAKFISEKRKQDRTYGQSFVMKNKMLGL